MTYKVLSLKWRPRVFQDIVGQDHITKTLVNAFKKNRVAQGYMFTGPRGVGKTTTARILSMALNADGGPNFNFDPDSNTAIEISEGRALDVMEIDGASNRGIEEIRNLREQIKFAPMTGQYKVIIIDEVHMLTNPAFNALLRTLEEPPEHGKFIFCTTDIHKVPATIISRCQRFDFNRIATETIIDRISFILEKEKINTDKNSLQIIARKADGSMRDGLSILDQVISFCGSDIDYDQTVSALGIIPNDLYFNYTESINNKNGEKMLAVLEQFSKYGVPASEVNNGIGIHLKNLLYSKIKNGSEMLDMNEENKKQYLDHAKDWDNRDLLRVSQIISDVSSYINRSNDPYLLMEVTSLKLLEMERSVSLDALLRSDNLSVGKDDGIKKNDLENYTKKQVFSKKDYNIVNDENKVDSVNKGINKDNHNKEVKNQINEEKKINESDASNSITIDIIQDNWKNFIDKLHIKKPSIASVMDNSVPVDFKNGKIIVQITSSLEFHLNMINKNYGLVKNILNDQFKIELDFVIEKKSESYSDDNITQDSVDGSNIQDDDQLRDKIVDLFDGEILT
tara:strand:- start:293 stop:1993 length:1701 start_codon:yes stop_codon:yes gene_type:complete